MSSFEVYADLSGLSFPAMQQMMLHEAAEHGLSVLENGAGKLRITSEFGSFGIKALDQGLRIEIGAQTANDLHVIREGVVEHLAHYLPEQAKSLEWSDHIQPERHPPNFQFATVLKVAPVSKNFLRLTLQLEKPELFDSRALHFRFLLPNAGNSNPEWPVLKENGSTRWPDGEMALHRPVYTIRRLDSEKGCADVDVFRHVGGRTYAWAKDLKTGDRVAMIGPGGGGVPRYERLVICGDETAYPAIARILDALPSAKGEVILLTNTGTRDYDTPIPDGMSLSWLSASNTTRLTESLEQALARNPDSYFWFAAEQKQSEAIRESTVFSTLPKTRRMIATYWMKATP